MLIKTTMKEYQPKLSWRTIGIFFLLILLATFIIGKSGKQSQNIVLQLFLDKGSTLINSIAHLTKDDTIGYNKGFQIQLVIDKLVRQKDVYFIVVTTQEKIFFAHSSDSNFPLNRSEINTLVDMASATVIPGDGIMWNFLQLNNNNAFVVYSRSPGIVSDSPVNVTQGNFKDGSFIFIGFNPELFLEVQDADKEQSLLSICTILFFCLLLLLSFIFFRNFGYIQKTYNVINALTEYVVLTSKDGLMLLDSAGAVLQMNPAAAQFFHISNPIIGSWVYLSNKKYDELFPPIFYDVIKQVIEQGKLEETELFLSLAGEEHYIIVQGNSLDTFKKGQPEYLLSFRDITKIRLLEKDLYQKDTLASIGSLASGVAHEIRSPLSSIKGYVNYLGDRLPYDSSDQELIKIIMQEIDRLNRVISDLIGLSVPTDVYPEYIDLQKVIEDTLRLVKLDAKRHSVELLFYRNEELPFVPLDPDRIRQVLLNLCLNALDAMPDGGSLKIIFDVNKNTQQFFLEVIDTGMGINEEVLPRIFDPYFTTKLKGTGLGLSTVRKIVEAHKGTILVSSELGKGTIFRLVFPLKLNEL